MMLSAAAVLAVGSVALTGLGGFAVYLLVANEPTSTEAAANSQAGGLGTMPSGPHRRDSISAEPMLQSPRRTVEGGRAVQHPRSEPDYSRCDRDSSL